VKRVENTGRSSSRSAVTSSTLGPRIIGTPAATETTTAGTLFIICSLLRASAARRSAVHRCAGNPLADTPCGPLQMESSRRATLKLFSTKEDEP
jgi:hypothetical protein